MRRKLLIIANNNIGTGQSGGDTIFLELTKRWSRKLDIYVFGSQETQRLLRRYHLQPKFIKTDSINAHSYPSLGNLLHHTWRRSWAGLKTLFKNKSVFTSAHYCYTVSDFFPDLFFGLIYKLINPQGTWICGQYLFAPPPWSINSPYRQQSLKGFFYYFYQFFSLFLARLFADWIFVTSAPDKIKFPHQKVIVVQGGVDVTPSKIYLHSHFIKPLSQRHFDAVFQGRLHPQKGVLELVDVWQHVASVIPQAKLAIIGDGQLESELKQLIKTKHLQSHITLFGFQSGESKYRIFKNSKIVVHPAIYDSGGMAAAEAMAWGLPGVSFDLESLKTYYPQGIIKTPCYDQQQFANNIVKLLQDQKLYRQTSRAALELIRKVWDWDKRAQTIYTQVFYENTLH